MSVLVNRHSSLWMVTTVTPATTGILNKLTSAVGVRWRKITNYNFPFDLIKLLVKINLIHAISQFNRLALFKCYGNCQLCSLYHCVNTTDNHWWLLRSHRPQWVVAKKCNRYNILHIHNFTGQVECYIQSSL